MDWDDEGLDEGPVPPLLPPEDRLWRHPSEVASNPSAMARTLMPPTPPKLITIVGLSSVISMLLTLGAVAVIRPLRTQVAVEHVPTATGSATQPPSAAADVASIAERLRPAILRVEADGTTGTRRGSGVLYRSDGLLLTSHQVVDGASTLRVVLDDGRQLPARFVGGDPDTDIAVLDVEGDRFAIAPLGSAASLRIGEPAITIGMPESGGGAVVTVGVVAATGRTVDTGTASLLDMIQTDTEVSPGCTGGAVVDETGVVFGIAARAAPGGSGYATPIDVARLVAAQLMNSGRVTRAWLGVEGDDLPATRAKEMGIAGGAVVKVVKSASPAVDAGLAPADVIAEVDGQPVRTMTELVVHLRMLRPGDTVTLAVVRNGDRRVMKVRLGEKP